MKTLKLFITALSLFTAAFTTAKADGNPAMLLTKEYAVHMYTDAMCQGKIKGLDEVLDSNATFNMVKGNKLVSNNKAELLKFLKENVNIKQNCTTSISVVDNNADVSVIKVDMHYANFVRSNYVTVVNTGNGWKITNVHSVFKS